MQLKLNPDDKSSSFGSSTESRPARKDYDKLSGEEQVGKNRNATLDNEGACRTSQEYPVSNGSVETDSESNFTDLEVDERDEFSDDSDYGRNFVCLEMLSNLLKSLRDFVKCDCTLLGVTSSLFVISAFSSPELILTVFN